MLSLLKHVTACAYGDGSPYTCIRCPPPPGFNFCHLLAALQAERYRLFAVGPPLTTPTKPGMIRANTGSCIKVPMELYDMPLTAVGAFISKVGTTLHGSPRKLSDGCAASS